MINAGQLLTFDPDVRSNLISINIVDDDVYEAKSENLLLALSTSTTGVHLSNMAELTIQDNDSKLSACPCIKAIDFVDNFDYSIVVTIGFNSTTYTVRESDGNVSLSIGLMDGMFGDVSVNVRLTTINGSAKGK